MRTALRYCPYCFFYLRLKVKYKRNSAFYSFGSMGDSNDPCFGTNYRVAIEIRLNKVEQLASVSLQTAPELLIKKMFASAIPGLFAGSEVDQKRGD
jgi:hypothetical protein